MCDDSHPPLLYTRKKPSSERRKVATVLFSADLHPPGKDNSVEWTFLSLSTERYSRNFQSGNTWDTIRDTEEREGVVGWWLLATPLVTFVPILARFEIRPIVWDFDRRRERRRDGEKEKLSVREDGQARYRRGKTWGRGEEVDRGHPAAPVCARRTVFRALMRADWNADRTRVHGVDGVSRVMNRVLAKHDVTTNVEPATRLYNAGLDIVAEVRPRLAGRVLCSVTSTRIIC